jgi:type I restriction enzyme S subunit
MNKWKECTLGDVMTLQRGYDLPSQHRELGTVPIISSSGITAYHSVAKVSGPGVITGRYGTIGEVFFSKKDFWPLNTTLYVKDFKGNDCKFAYYALKNFDFEEFNDKSAVPGINRNHVHEARILLPPLPEQRAIAGVLSSLDDKIDLLHRQNKTLEGMAEALWRKMFVEEAKESWKTVTIKYFANILSGFAFKSSDFVDIGKYRLVTIKNVQDGYLDFSRLDYLNTIPTRLPYYCLLEIGDILLSLTGNVGRCCLVNEENLLLNQRVGKLQARNIRDWAFIYIMFRQASMKSALEELSKGTAQANLSPIETANFEMQAPPDCLLEKYSRVVTPQINKVLINFHHIRTLTRLRDALLPKLMSGELRVTI